MSRNRGHIPIRTCISCGAKRPKRELVRWVLGPDGMVIEDPVGKGRGAYICRDEACLSVLKTGKGLNRAFKRSVSIDSSVKTIK